MHKLDTDEQSSMIYSSQRNDYSRNYAGQTKQCCAAHCFDRGTTLTWPKQGFWACEQRDNNIT